jgi:general secretion pathway protein K
LKFTKKLLMKNERGVALLLAMFTVVLITFIVTEILYETNVEYIVNSSAINRVKAYYAARSGYQMSLLRVKLYKKVQGQFGSQLPEGQKKLLEMIWQMPFSWPPMLPEDAGGVDRDMITDKVKEAALDANYSTTITDEGSKIDINDLGSPSKGLREVTKKLLLQIFENQIRNDEEWARRNENIEYERVINNIADWVDGDSVGSSGSDERSTFSGIAGEKPYPPNRSFRTIEEIRLVPGVTEEIFKMLRDRITVYGTRSINPNHASGDLLKSLDPSITSEVVSKVLSRREDPEKGPFKDENDFWTFVNSEGANVSEEIQKAVPLIFSKVTNFRIKSIGEHNNTIREIEAVVFDFGAVSQSIANRLQKEANDAIGATPPADDKQKDKTNTTKSNEPLPKGPPRVVYFIER